MGNYELRITNYEWVLGVGCRVSGVGCRVSGVGCRVSGDSCSGVPVFPPILNYGSNGNPAISKCLRVLKLEIAKVKTIFNVSI